MMREEPLDLLIISDNLPRPADNGQRLKLANLLDSIGNNRRIGIVCLDYREDLAPLIDDLRSTVSVLAVLRTGLSERLIYGSLAVLSGLPFYCAELVKWRTELRRLVEVHTGAGAAIHLDGIKLLPLLDYVKAGTPVSVSTTDSIARSYERMAAESNGRLLRLWRTLTARATIRLEVRFLPKVARLHVVSPHDQQYIAAYLPAVAVEVIPISVPRLEFAALTQRDGYPENRRVALPSLFVSGSVKMAGVINGMKAFTQNCWPKINASGDRADLVVLCRGASDEFLRAHLSGDRIVCKRFVTDYLAELMSHTIHVFPDRGGTGIKNRVLLALLSGRPVIGTRSAFEGVPVVDGVSAIICETMVEFESAINYLLENETVARQIGQAGSLLVQQHFSPESAERQWTEYFTRLNGMRLGARGRSGTR